MLKVYYLDDEQDLLDVFSETLSSPQVQVRTFSDPAALIEAVQEAPPHLLFLDYRLPRTTGDAVAQKLDASVPKVLVTGDVLIHTQVQYLAVLTKPFELKAVRELIDRALTNLAGS
ncbi:MAG: response regulator [Oligoflexia bacterium]|jgi:DNA-binding NtrC family response regulator